MAFASLKRKFKFLIIILVVVLVIIIIVKLARAKTAVIDFIHREDGLEKVVTALSGKNIGVATVIPLAVDFSRRILPKDKRRKKHQSTVEVEAAQQSGENVSDNHDQQTVNENLVDIDAILEAQRLRDQEVAKDVQTTSRGTLPRRSNSKVSKYKREEMCRKIIEDYFDDYFPTCRPKFLANPKTGYPLELDAYNPRLNLSMEVQGRQHREYPNYFHKTREEFDKQLERDAFKRQRLSELGIDLIEIDDRIPTNQLETYIHGVIKQLGK